MEVLLLTPLAILVYLILKSHFGGGSGLPPGE